MSNLDGVKAAVERWMGRVSSDAAAHVDKPTVVTTTLYPDQPAKVEVAHEDGSEPERKEASREQYGTPVHPEGVTPFGESGQQGRQWAANPPAGQPQRSADLEHVQETERTPDQPVGNGPGEPDGINAGITGTTTEGAAPAAE